MTPGGFSSRMAPVAIGPCNHIPACVPIFFNHWWHGKYLAALYCGFFSDQEDHYIAL